MTQRRNVFAFEVRRLDRPPLTEALRVLDENPRLGMIGSTFYIVRRSRRSLWPRWNVTEIAVLGIRGEDGVTGVHAFPWMRRIGFGMFMRTAAVDMSRCPPYEVPPYIDGVIP